MNTSKNYGIKSYAEAADKVEEYETVEEKFHAFLSETASTFLEPRKHLRANLIKCSGVRAIVPPWLRQGISNQQSTPQRGALSIFFIDSSCPRITLALCCGLLRQPSPSFAILGLAFKAVTEHNKTTTGH